MLLSPRLNLSPVYNIFQIKSGEKWGENVALQASVPYFRHCATDVVPGVGDMNAKGF